MQVSCIVETLALNLSTVAGSTNYIRITRRMGGTRRERSIHLPRTISNLDFLGVFGEIYVIG